MASLYKPLERNEKPLRYGSLIFALREFFSGRGFEEVFTPLLSAGANLDSHVEPLAVVDAGGGRMYLRTSPEHFHKRLLCRGRKRIFEAAKVARDEEAASALHGREFTLLEWYRSGEGCEAVMEDVEEVVAFLARRFAGGERLSYGGESIDLRPPFERISVREAIRRFAGGLDPFEIEGDEEFAAAAVERGFKVGGAGIWEWEDTFFLVLVEAVEPCLPRDRPVILYDYPERLCVYARPKPGSPETAERFEVYAGGMELANGFGEVNDAVLQRRRFERELDRRRRRGEPLLPVDEDFLAEMAGGGMPFCSGAALGVERLAMLLSGARDISEVMEFASEAKRGSPASQRRADQGDYSFERLGAAGASSKPG